MPEHFDAEFDLEGAEPFELGEPLLEAWLARWPDPRAARERFTERFRGLGWEWRWRAVELRMLALARRTGWTQEQVERYFLHPQGLGYSLPGALERPGEELAFFRLFADDPDWLADPATPWTEALLEGRFARQRARIEAGGPLTPRYPTPRPALGDAEYDELLEEFERRLGSSSPAGERHTA